MFDIYVYMYMFYHVYVLFMSHGIYFTKMITCAEGILTPGRRSCLRLAYCTEFMCNSCRDIEWGIHFLTSCSICLPHNELPLCTPPLHVPPPIPTPPLAGSPGTEPSADPDCSSPTRTLPHLREKMTGNTIRPGLCLPPAPDECPGYKSTVQGW